ncbi:membrane protein insertase YidC [Pseudenhygromyxa sp. WMMC2535]|uniref:membrane protein insertase YidC n=1 Tax=Pseudenhygromyxa sp. WMMC2535 TaxID=2712867 RepID=UPI001553BB2F|nr:membrane protein insertase YidC [Pseudenhygromyxa sp. WMMC2535]NVB37878.1 membrane protein insertase YidC [Pseudenhygromyxa sp. WMMC2535]
MEMKHRMVLAGALSVLILIGFNYFFPPPTPTEVEAEGDEIAAEGGEQGEGEQGEQAEGEAPEKIEAAGGEQPGGEQAGGEQPGTSPAPAQERVEHRLTNDLLAITVDNQAGGLITGVEPLSEQFRDEESGEGLDFLLLGDSRTLELGFVAGETDFGWSRIPAEVRSKTDQSIELVRRQGDIEVVETLTLLDGYEASYQVIVRNFGAGAVKHRVELRTRMGLGAKSRYDIHRGLCRSTEDLEDFDAGDVEDEHEVVKGGLDWFALDSKYFLQAVVPGETFSGCEVSSDEDNLAMLNAGIGREVTLQPGEQKRYEFGIYLGAKVDSMLAAFPASEGLELPAIDMGEAVDWGWFGRLSKYLGSMMLDLLRWFYGLTGIWGVAIIMLTVVVKLVLLPLTIKQYRSMRKLKEINPEIQKLREKYGDDKVKMNQEMQALFQRAGTSPLSGCLPMLVQFPVWIALYAMLGAVVDLYHESFLWLPDLTQPDPFYLLPIGMGGLMFLQTRMNPNTGDEMQAKMMQWMMPGIFVVMMLFLPSGLGVYIFANITLSLIQSFIQLRIPTGDDEGKAASGA